MHVLPAAERPTPELLVRSARLLSSVPVLFSPLPVWPEGPAARLREAEAAGESLETDLTRPNGSVLKGRTRPEGQT